MKRNELKVIIAILLLMVTLFALASLVSAGFVEEILGDVGEIMGSSGGHVHGPECYESYTETGKCELMSNGVFCNQPVLHGIYCTGGVEYTYTYTKLICNK